MDHRFSRGVVPPVISRSHGGLDHSAVVEHVEPLVMVEAWLMIREFDWEEIG